MPEVSWNHQQRWLLKMQSAIQEIPRKYRDGKRIADRPEPEASLVPLRRSTQTSIPRERREPQWTWEDSNISDNEWWTFIIVLYNHYAHNDYDSNDHVTCDLDHTKLVVRISWYANCTLQKQLYCRTALFVRKNVASKIIMAAKSVQFCRISVWILGSLNMKLKLFGSDKILEEVFCNHLQKYFRRVESAQTDAMINHLLCAQSNKPKSIWGYM